MCLFYIKYIECVIKYKMIRVKVETNRLPGITTVFILFLGIYNNCFKKLVLYKNKRFNKNNAFYSKKVPMTYI